MRELCAEKVMHFLAPCLYILEPAFIRFVPQLGIVDYAIPQVIASPQIVVYPLDILCRLDSERFSFEPDFMEGCKLSQDQTDYHYNHPTYRGYLNIPTNIQKDANQTSNR